MTEDKRVLNILSIDWDYFVQASMEERISLFPDGHDGYPAALNDIIWAGHYRDERLREVSVDKDAIKAIRALIRKKSTDCQFMVVDSHKYIYDFVNDMYSDYEAGYLNLVNVDFHHDAYDSGENLDCGNWLRLFVENYDESDSSFVWVARHDSDHGNMSDAAEKRISVQYDFEGLSAPWDGVFICRSALWSPPHLDRDFYRFCKPYLDKFPTLFERGVTDSRFCDVKRIYSQELRALASCC